MATTETAIANLALIGMGQLTIASIDSGTDTLSIKCNALFDQCRDELLISGPEKGWKFAKRTYHGIDVDSCTITHFTFASSTTTTVTATHAFAAGDTVTISGTTNYDGTYDVVSVSTTKSFVITKAYVADDATGTAQWTSDEYAYRYAIPASKKVISVLSGGIELSDWTRQGNWILTNEESSEVDMVIIQAITDVTLFPDWFVKVLVLDLQIALVYNITQDLKAIQLFEMKRELAMAKAMAMDESQKYVQESSTAWIDAGR